MAMELSAATWFRRWARGQVRQALFEESDLVLTNKFPALVQHFDAVDSLGLYLHIPFCRQICPYCPYNKTLYGADIAERYASAVLQEIDRYAAIVGSRPVTSFYIGGGTPTTLLYTGLARILSHIYCRFNMQCGAHMESHPNDLSPENLSTMTALGVEYVSIGVEALQDRHLRTLCRTYQATEAQQAVERAVRAGFKSVNADLIFALPGQTKHELEDAVMTLVETGVQQITAYPLFIFPYTAWPQLAQCAHYPSYSLLQKRRMLRVVEELVYDAGYQRSSVWAFTRAGVPKYCSVTVPLYLGLGASASSYLRAVFYLNTFNVPEYIRALADGRMPIALSLNLSERMQMAGWLYWRIYETRFRKADFHARFHQDFDAVYGRYLRPLSLLGLLTDQQGEIALTDTGAYWLHAVQDWFSIDYVSTLWGTSRENPWPSTLLLT